MVTTVADMVANPSEATFGDNLIFQTTVCKQLSLRDDGRGSPIDDLGMCQVIVHRMRVATPNGYAAAKTPDMAGRPWRVLR